LIIYDEFSKRLYDLVVDNNGERKILKSNKEKYPGNSLFGLKTKSK